MSTEMNRRTKNEPDGSVTKWESYDGGKSWAMVEQTYPDRSAATVEPRLLQGVLEDLERHIALREAFRKLMGAKRGK